MPTESPVTQVEIEQSTKDGLWYMRAKGANGETIWDAEGHENYTDAVDISARSFPTVSLFKIETVEGVVVEEEILSGQIAEIVAAAEGKSVYGQGGEAEGD